ncbi:MAG: hypothetical protein RLY92_326 [Chloroflexota bacterium]
MKNLLRTCFAALLAALRLCQPVAVLAAGELPPDSKPDVRFGAVEAWMEPAAAEALRVGWDRLLIDWYKYQPEAPEEWVPSADDDARVNTALAAGREMVLLLRGTPAWATDGAARASPPRGLHLPVAANSNLWANFVHRVMKHYKGRVSRYIIWNEPDIAVGDGGAQFNGSIEQYYRMVKIAWLVAREVDPQAKIHLAGLTYWHDAVNGRTPFLERYLALVARDSSARANNFYFDAATLHIYFRPQSVFDLIALHRKFLHQYGLAQPIWLNETNAAPFDDALLPWPNPFVYVTMEQQGAFVIQAFALALAAGAERAAVYKFAEVSGSLPGFDYYGLYRTDMTARPAVESLRAVTTHFAGVLTTSYVMRASHYIVRLDRGGLVTRVLRRPCSTINLAGAAGSCWRTATAPTSWRCPARIAAARAPTVWWVVRHFCWWRKCGACRRRSTRCRTHCAALAQRRCAGSRLQAGNQLRGLRINCCASRCCGALQPAGVPSITLNTQCGKRRQEQRL